MTKILSRLVFGLALFGAPMLIVGCGEENKTEVKTTDKTPEGTTVKTETVKTEKSGEAPPPAAPVKP